MVDVSKLETTVRGLRIKILDAEKKLRTLTANIESSENAIKLLNDAKAKISEENARLANMLESEKNAIASERKALEIERAELLEREIELQKIKEEVDDEVNAAKVDLQQAEVIRRKASIDLKEAARIAEENKVKKADVDKRVTEIYKVSKEIDAKLEAIKIESAVVESSKELLIQQKNEAKEEFERLGDRDLEIASMLSQIAIDRRKLEEAKDCLKEDRQIIVEQLSKLNEERNQIKVQQKSFIAQKKALEDMENEVELRRLRVEKIINDNNIKAELEAMEKYR